MDSHACHLFFDAIYSKLKRATIGTKEYFRQQEIAINTPDRLSEAWDYFTSGYSRNPVEILSTQFDSCSDDMVIVKNIEFSSMCEHHLLPFFGKCTVGYIPSDKKGVGLSKIPRLVECFALRLQMQERLAFDIANAMYEHIPVLGVGVHIEATHTCMALRGVKQREAKMISNVLLGTFREDKDTRAEFLELIR